MTLEIFVPFWGDPALLYETVDSVRAQRNPDWRLIVIDDCYPDDAVPAYFAATRRRPRITYVRNEVEPRASPRTTARRSGGRRPSTSRSSAATTCCTRTTSMSITAHDRRQCPTPTSSSPESQVIDEHGTVIRPLVDRVKQGILAPRGGERHRRAHAASAWRRASSAATGCTGRRSRSAPRRCKRIDFRDGLPIIQDLALLMDIAFEGGTLAYNPTLAFSYRRHGGSASQKTLLDGRRFRDERTYYAEARRLARAQGWTTHGANRPRAASCRGCTPSPSCPASSGTERAPG